MVDEVLSEAELRKVEEVWSSEASMKKIEENWSEFEKWAAKVGPERAPAVKSMLEELGEQACMAPASGRFEFHNAFPGGFIDHSLRVMTYTVKLAQAWGVKNLKPESIIMASLFHDWGKIGGKDVPYYIPEESMWHRQRGKVYNHNPKSRIGSNAQLGLYTLSQFKVDLTEDEYLSILLNDGPYEEANRKYSMKEPQLALLVHFADRWATQCEKGRKSLLEPATPKF